MKTFTLEPLQNALRYWEDANYFGELMFQSKIKGLNPSSAIYITIPGTEITEAGWLGRKIENFELLKKEIQSGSVKDPFVYLPRLPKQYTGVYPNAYVYLEHLGHGFAQLPIHLAQWLKTKKVCRLTQEAEIPRIPVREKNYLSLLPYDNFVIYLNDPFVFNMADLGDGLPEYIEYFHTLMVSKSGNTIRIFAIANGLEEFCLEPVERKHVADAIHFAKAGKVQSYKQSMQKIFAQRRVPADMKTLDRGMKSLMSGDFSEIKFGDQQRIYNFTGRGSGCFFNMEVQISGPSSVKKGLFSSIKKSVRGLFKKETQRQPFFEILPDFLNGFCKVLSEATTDSAVKFNGAEEGNQEDGAGKKANRVSSPLSIVSNTEWFDVPLGNVIDLRVEKDGASVIKSFVSNASEKSPHERRGHWRSIIQKNATVKRVWISSTTVRKDKLQTEQIKSGTMVVK